MTDQFIIKWWDSGEEPQCEPNPNYPEGIDLDLTSVGMPSCETKLPYPAKRIGHYVVTCTKCGLRFAVTTAGRPDDPRSVKVGCKTQFGRA
jgi:hypothetical protein